MATRKLRSQMWFDDPNNLEMTALYLERYLNYGFTRKELQSGKPMIAIAQTGSDLSPCNRHHLALAERVREGIRTAGGIALEVPVHPIQETGKRPTAMLDRNLAYLSLVETLFGYPIDGVVLTVGCDKTTPALLMAAATVDIPAIAFSVGPMLNGWLNGQRVGSGTVIWQARQLHAAGKIDGEEFMEMAAASAPSVGFCNTMGTASTLNGLTEALGMQLSGSAAIPAPYRERGQKAYQSGVRIVEMVRKNIKPSAIMTRQAFENAIVVNSALGGSTNAPIHLNAIAEHVGVKLDNQDWQDIGYEIPLLVNMQPAGQYLGEDFHRAGGVPAVIAQLLKAGLLPHPNAMTVTGKSIADNCREVDCIDDDVIFSPAKPLKKHGGFLNLRGNLCDSALMKVSVISAEFHKRYLADKKSPQKKDTMCFRGRAVVFDGAEDFHARIDKPSLKIDKNCILVMRGCGPVGYPGAAEVVNMRPPDYLIKKGVTSLPCIGDGRQSGTSASPSILNLSPEAAVGGNIAILKTGDIIEVNLEKSTLNMLLDDDEIKRRQAALAKQGGYPVPPPQSPWQEILREKTKQLKDGMTLKGASGFKKIAAKFMPRHNH